MSVRKIVIGVVLILVGVPLVMVLGFAALASVLNQTNGSLVSSGQKREYLLHVPPKYDRARPTALVISMHGAALWPAAQMKTSQWNTVADEQGFIVVYPSGTGFPRIFPMEGEALTADVRFISDLIDKLEAGYNIDRSRIYADGFSNGGGMAFALSCTLSDRIAAVGIVAGAQLLPWSWCTDSRPVPMIAFHGTADPIVPVRGRHDIEVSDAHAVSERAQVDGELGREKPMRRRSRGIGRCRPCLPARVHEVRRRRDRGVVYRRRRRPLLAGRQAHRRVVGRADEP